MDASDSTTPTLGSLRQALLADTDTTRRNMLADCLRARGYQLTIAETGAMAWVEFQQAFYALVIFGDDLENMTGLDLLQHMSQSEYADASTLVMLVNPEDASESDAALQGGAQWCLPRNISRLAFEAGLPILESLIRDRLVSVLSRTTETEDALETGTREAYAEALRKQEEIVLCSRLLRGGEPPDAVLPEVLRRLLRVSGTRRVVYCENHQERDGHRSTRLLHGHTETGGEAPLPPTPLHRLQYADGFSRWERLLEYGHIVSGETSQFPASEQRILLPAGMGRVLVLPILTLAGWRGFLAFDEAAGVDDWDAATIRLLRLGAEIISAYFDSLHVNDLTSSAREEAQRAEAALTSLQAQHDALQQAHASQAAAMDEMRTEMQALQAELDRTEDARILRERCQKLEDERRRQLVTTQNLTHDADKLRGELAELQQQFDVLQESNAKLDAEGQELRGKRVYLKRQLDATLADTQELRTALQNARKDTDNAKRRLEQVAAERNEVQARLEAAESELAEVADAGTESPDTPDAALNWETLTQATLHAVFVLDPDGIVLEANELALQIYHATGNSLGGKSFFDLHEPKVAESQRRQLTEAMESREPRRSFMQISNIPYEVAIYPVCGPDSTPQRLLVFERDQSLHQIIVRRERLASVGALAGGVAHEFNNLNTGIIGFASLMLDDPKLDPAVRRRLELILQAAERAKRIAARMLSLSRTDERPQEAVDLSEVVRDGTDLTRRLFEAEGVRLDVLLQPTPPTRMSSPAIGQIVINLLINALHAVRGREEKTITVRTGISDDQVFLSITDTGCGISPDEQERIFRPFYTTKGEHASHDSPLSTVRGSGLGLSVSETIAHEHGGELTVESEPGRGATFTLKIPLGHAQAEAEKSTDAPQIDLPGIHAGILGCDEVLSGLLTDLLHPTGCDTLVLQTPDALDDPASLQSLDLLVLDIKNDFTPYQQRLEALREGAGAQAPRLILLADRGSDLTSVNGVNPLAILHKPFTRQDVLAVLKRIATTLDPAAS